MATTTIIPLHAGKRRTVATALGMSLGYVKNPDKTDGGELVTSYECDPLTADAEFIFAKNQYVAVTGRSQGAHDVIGYHLRISFKPGETDAETANKIGYELALKLTKGQHSFVCCTHIDKSHIHSHIVINSTSLDYSKKFRNFKGSAFAVRKIADYLCVQNGLSIIEKPKPSRGSYANWQGDSRPQSNREKLKKIIDTAIQNAKDYDEFIAAMITAGCEVKRGKYLAFKITGAGQYARCKSLGDDYTEEAILQRLAGVRKISSSTFIPFKVTGETNFGLLVDIQQKIKDGKGEAYQKWAQVYNLKQAARTLIYLQENGIDSYDELTKKSATVSANYDSRLKRIREIESRQKEISSLQKHIGSYGKTRDVYLKYKESGWSNKFYNEHAADIILHKAAKKYFDDLGMKKLPSMNSLKLEWATLEAEKKTLYRGYHEIKSHHRELLMAKDNVERFLGIGKSEPDLLPLHKKKSHEI